MIAKKTDIKFSSTKNELMISQYWGKKGLERDKVSITYAEVPDGYFREIHKEGSYKIKQNQFLKKKTFENVIDFKYREGNVLVLVLSIAFLSYSDTKALFKDPSIRGIEDNRFEQRSSIDEVKPLTFNTWQYKSLPVSKMPEVDEPTPATPPDEEGKGGCPSSSPCSKNSWEVEIPLCIVKKGKLIQLVNIIDYPILYGFPQPEKENDILPVELRCCGPHEPTSAYPNCLGEGGGETEQSCSDCHQPRDNDDKVIEIDYGNWFGIFKLFSPK